MMHHRRQSSWWIPPMPPVIDRLRPNISKCVPAFIWSQSSATVTTTECRSIEPNWLPPQSHLPRYHLPNYRNYCSNKISTTKYSLLTFVPLNLWEQFHRFANIYFIIIVGLNWVPALEAVSRFVGMIPVGVILCCTAIKDLVEDLRRNLADRRLNRTCVHAWDSQAHRFRKTRWENLLVGDLVHLGRDQPIPADILILRSSDPQGSVFMETANLDGESNLKQRTAINHCKAYCGSVPLQPEQLIIRVECSLPNHKLSNISGSVYYGQVGAALPTPIDSITPANVLLRGCTTRNIAFVEGIVLYTGNDTKLILNSGSARYKRSAIERRTNYFIGCYIGMLALLVIASGVGSFLWLLSFSTSDAPIPFLVMQTGSAIGDGGINLAEFLICYQTLVPLSLYIIIELIKLGQCYLLVKDIELYDEASDKPLLCRSLNIPEELGNIQHVLTDKTGTLTENKMVYRACAIDGVGFEEPMGGAVNKELLQVLHAALKDQHTQQSPHFYFFLVAAICNSVIVRREQDQGIDEMEKGGYLDAAHSDMFFVGNSVFYDAAMSPAPSSSEEGHHEMTPTTINDIDMIGTLKKGAAAAKEQQHLSPDRNHHFSFMPDDLMRRLNSTMNIKSFFAGKNKSKNSNHHHINDKKHHLVKEENNRPLYDGESPDELCLVKTAEAYGFVLDKRTINEVTVRIRTDDTQKERLLEHRILKVIPFDSTRKRVSIAVKMGGDDGSESGRESEVLLLCKGADDAILNRLSLDYCRESASQLAANKRLLQQYSTAGLRTLCMAMRVISHLDFNRWLSKREQIETLNIDDSDALLTQSNNEIECDLQLLGVSAIEDKLQDGVGETIESLRLAGMNIWLLTGDKLETALNIAHSSRLFQRETATLVIQSDDDLEAAVRRCSSSSASIGTGGTKEESFNLVLSSEGVKMLCSSGRADMMDMLIRKSQSVLCFRLIPSEKADVVAAVKRYLKGSKGKVLAIGDGANDVPMLLGADVGVGLCGQEGLQAMMASDFAIARFRFLRRLLLVHGHWNYHRLAGIILYLLCKNAVFVSIFVWAQFFNGFSGFAPIDPFYSMLYPILFTSAQPFFYGVMDQDSSVGTLLTNPELYSSGREGRVYTIAAFAWNVMDAIWQSVAIYFTGHMSYWDTTIDIWAFSFFLSTAMFFTNSFHLALITNSWTWLVVATQLLFAALHFAFFIGYGEVCSAHFPSVRSPPVGVFLNEVLDPLFWTGTLLAVLIALLPRFVLKIATPPSEPSSLQRRQSNFKPIK